MKKFQFRLATVLKQREDAQERMLVALASAQRAYQAEVRQKNEFLGQLDGALNRREALGQAATPITDFQLEQAYIVGTKQRIVRAEQAIVRATRGVEKALRGYLVARRAARAIEVLKEKDFAEFKSRVRKREQKENDDLTIMRHRFKQLENDSEGVA